MKKFLIFIFVPLLANGCAEIVNQIYIRHAVGGFFHTIVSYVILLVTLYFIRKLFIAVFPKNFLGTVAWYVVLGGIGLVIEWFLLGNKGVAWYGQIAMFTFWGSFGMLPAIFAEQPTFSTVQKPTVIYLFCWIVIYLIAGFINPGLGLLLWILGSVILNYFYVRYFVLLATHASLSLPTKTGLSRS